MDRRSALEFAGFIRRRFRRALADINVASSSTPIPIAKAVACGAMYFAICRTIPIIRCKLGILRRPSFCATLNPIIRMALFMADAAAPPTIVGSVLITG